MLKILLIIVYCPRKKDNKIETQETLNQKLYKYRTTENIVETTIRINEEGISVNLIQNESVENFRQDNELDAFLDSRNQSHDSSSRRLELHKSYIADNKLDSIFKRTISWLKRFGGICAF